jgi:4-hydroxy-2-oxoglutarate aldolase
MINLSGIYPPIVVPFKETGQIDLESFKFNLKKWMDQGLSGVIFPGSNSESPFLTQNEKIKLLKLSATYVKEADKMLIAGTGMESTAETIKLTNIAAEIGADAALIIPPYFYKPEMKHNVLIEHYFKVADASKIPLLIYNVPVFSGVDFLPETVIKLSEHSNIIGMKDSSSNVIKTSMILAEKPNFLIFCGTGGSLLPFLSIGAVGGIMALANFAGKPLMELYTAFQKNDIILAKQLQYMLVSINTAVTSKYGIPGLKYAMNKSGFKGGFPRRPLLPLDRNGCNAIDELLLSIR